MDSAAIIAQALAFLPDLEAVFLFGSAARGAQRPDSDLDLAVLLPSGRTANAEALAGLKSALEDASGRDVDLIDLAAVNTVFQHEIVMEGKNIYSRKGFDLHLYRSRVMGQYQKLNEERAGILQRVLETGRVFR